MATPTQRRELPPLRPLHDGRPGAGAQGGRAPGWPPANVTPKSSPTAGRPPIASAALDAYRRAVQLYPNNALYHAEFALALRAVGQRDAFRREADAALDLDKLNPHAEKRLPPEVRKRLEK